MVLLTVRSLGSFLRTFSYSAMAFCSLPCWTNFSAALRAFCLLKPKPNAIKCADSSLFPVERPRFPRVMPNGFEPRREIPRRNPANPSFAAPAGSATLTSSFQNINANGIWSFYLFDANAGCGGTIGQVCLNFTENAPVLSIAKSHTGNFTQGDAADTYTILVTNNGPGPTGGTVTVTEVPPTG